MPSSKFLFIFFLVFVAACSSDEHQSTDLAQALPEEPSENFRTRCDQQSIALDCAKYAYRIKQTNPNQALIYAQKACDLKDQTSCFNVEQFKSRSMEHNSNLIRLHNDQILGCYANHSEDKSYAGFSLVKEEKHKILDIQFLISPTGQLDHISIQGRKLSEKFKECVTNLFITKKFLSSPNGQRINYGLILPFIEGTKTNPKTYF